MKKSLRKKVMSKIIVPVATVVAVLAAGGNASMAVGNGVEADQGKVGAAGNWALLNGAYEDWSQQEIPFGKRSYFLTPWRSYMDTRSATAWNNVLGINFNVTSKEAATAAQVLKEAGIRSARVEIGWGSVSYADETKLVDPESTRAVITALKNAGIRPLILLNANSGLPAPNQKMRIQLTRAAKKGDRVIYLSDVQQIKPYYTGLQNMAYQTMYPVITKVDAATGQATLSAPLPKDLPVGNVDLTKLKYQPFSGKTYADGTSNPAAQETLDGWLRYVKTVTGFVRDVLGTTGKTDAGFDVEVWNELSFGSQFTKIENYYDPKPVFSQPIRYEENGKKVEGVETILPLTIQYIRNPQNKLPGVKVINGFSNQRPWDNGADLWNGQTGFSRHYYTGYSSKDSYISVTKADATKNLLDAGETGYVPEFVSAFPESWFYASTTENIVRDLQPFPNLFDNHYRYSNPGDGHQAEVWMTETNFYRKDFAQDVSSASGKPISDPAISNLMQDIAAKAALRIFTFYGHKGINTVELYAAKSKDSEFSFLPEAFYNELSKSNGTLTAGVRNTAGKQWEAIHNVTRLMSQGVPITNVRDLKVERVEEFNPQVVLQGDGTADHPTLYNRDDLAVLPYQLDDNKYAIGYYVVTRDLTKSYKPEENVLKSDRYDMPEQKFRVTLSNLVGKNANVYVYDPLTDKKLPVENVQGGSDTLTVDLGTVDYPRFLMVEEKTDGPLIMDSVLSSAQGGAGATLSFVPNVDGTAKITWGSYPQRTGGTFTEKAYKDERFTEPLNEKDIGLIQYNKTLSSRKGSYRWTGTITPDKDDTYTFIINSDSSKHELKIGNQTVIPLNTGLKSGQVFLKAGTTYNLTLSYSLYNDNPHSMSLFWASNDQPRQAVSPSDNSLQMVQLKVEKGKKAVVRIPKLSVGEGVKIQLQHQGPITKFPQWDYDVSGVKWK
ncbi:PA14 domain-containing protein [Gorillibacterium massiliense]|uniref:PA14 domain-containing protein n=1 Tax=Gorillibacterium massiliense TaxID=1280390 RepID=UPI0004B8E58E|nr:PA14 domain-containing protein [Gorillibacterium massiliense]